MKLYKRTRVWGQYELCELACRGATNLLHDGVGGSLDILAQRRLEQLLVGPHLARLHDLDHALVDVGRALEPHVTIDAVLDAVDGEVDVRDRQVLLFCAVAHRQCVLKLLALEATLEEVVVDYFIVVLRHQVQ